MPLDGSWNLNPCIWRPWHFDVRNLNHGQFNFFSPTTRQTNEGPVAQHRRIARDQEPPTQLNPRTLQLDGTKQQR